MEQIKQATIKFHMEIRDERENRNLQSRDNIRSVPSEHSIDGQ
jgi:hypothetical protein